MLSDALAVCPLWLLFKFHKGWNQKSAKVAPTRPVAGGNEGMNFPLYEIISWILEPLASTIEGSSEVISGEDLWNRVDGVNIWTKDRSPEPTLKGKLDEHPGMVESKDPLKLCECDPREWLR